MSRPLKPLSHLLYCYEVRGFVVRFSFEMGNLLVSYNDMFTAMGFVGVNFLQPSDKDGFYLPLVGNDRTRALCYPLQVIDNLLDKVVQTSHRHRWVEKKDPLATYNWEFLIKAAEDAQYAYYQTELAYIDLEVYILLSRKRALEADKEAMPKGGEPPSKKARHA